MHKPKAAVPWRRATRFRFRIVVIAIVFTLSLWYLVGRLQSQSQRLAPVEIARRYPLVWEHIGTSNQTGGAWYIPPSWLGSEQPPQTIVEAARLASSAAMSRPERQLPFSSIPFIIHQTYKTTEVEKWSAQLFPFVEHWLTYAAKPREADEMAYFLWDDQGISGVMRDLEADFASSFKLFSRIEQTDIFRIIACKWFGGIYADMDTEPLRPPQNWIGLSDLSAWVDPVSGEKHGLDIKQAVSSSKSPPVSLIGGVEADLDPDTDTYWRMGYSYPVQLTQWALASAPQHHVLESFMTQLRTLANDAVADAKKSGKKLTSLEKAYAVERTGPVAFTNAVRSYLEMKVGLRWNSLTGREDNGKVKLVADVLILPITGFSPGRQKIMGSKPIDDVEARLNHHFFGSWRHFNVAAESGKLCRTLFGMCKDWSMADS
ncbi:glycosyltransferase family 32 protein [Sarocladium strictum]